MDHAQLAAQVSAGSCFAQEGVCQAQIDGGQDDGALPHDQDSGLPDGAYITIPAPNPVYYDANFTVDSSNDGGKDAATE